VAILSTSFETSNSNEIQKKMAVNMDAGRHCTLKVRVVNDDDIKGAPIVVSSPHLLTLIINYKPHDIMEMFGPSTLRPFSCFHLCGSYFGWEKSGRIWSIHECRM